MTGPARITIELQPATDAGDHWVTRSRVDDGPTLAAAEPLHTPEAREPAVMPVGYEPPQECTCVDGFCDADHANE